MRAGVEIRDAMAALAFRLPVGAWHEALAAAGASADTEAIAAAGWIRAALATPSVRTGPLLTRSPAPPEGADIDDDLERLAGIARVPDGVALRVAAAITAAAGRERAR